MSGSSAKTAAGNFFEDFRIGQEIVHATPRTVTAGDAALYLALYGSRFAVNCAEAAARQLGYPKTPIDDLLAFHIVFGKTVPDVSLNAIANLGVGVMPQARHRLKALLAGLHETLVAQHRVGADIFGYTGGAIPVGGMVTPHGQLGSTLVLLAGDAAGLTNPVSGAGIASAVISGTLAGQAAGDWLAGDAQAAEEYAAELDALFSRALARAVHRRAEVLYRYHDGHRPSPAALRRGWIAYEEYWAP